MGLARHTNLALLALVGGLSILVWLDLRGPNEPSEPPRLTSLRMDDVVTVQIVRPELTIDLRRDSLGWRMEHPYQVSADPRGVARLLEITQAYDLESYPLSAVELGEVGLDPPGMRLVVNSLEIGVGSTQPVTGQRYLRIGDRIHLINDRFPHLLFAAPELFVDPRPLPSSRNLQAVLASGWSLQRDADGAWRIDPPRTDLSPERPAALATAWDGVVADRIEAAGRHSGDGRVEVKLAGMGPLLFEVSREGDEVWLVRVDIGIAYRIPGARDLLEP